MEPKYNTSSEFTVISEYAKHADIWNILCVMLLYR